MKKANQATCGTKRLQATRNRERIAMSQRLTWFLFGAASASFLWLGVLALINHQLMETFFGFG